MRNKNLDFEVLARGLDISPSMHQYTVQRYGAISEYINSHGINANFYPQGSFRTGTVVRPVKDGVETDFDIDVVCELSTSKDAITPQAVKQSVGAVLRESEMYGKKLQPEEDRCWTLKYDAELIAGIGLKLDVVPCVKEPQKQILVLQAKSVPIEFAEQAVAITEKGHGTYFWQASNPGGYGDWFDQINKRYLMLNLQDRKAQFLRENRNLFAATATIEDVPDYYIKSPLQRVIQLIKRHRDIYYGRLSNGKNLRPISAIITTMAAKIAADATVYQIDELLAYVVTGMENYASLLNNRTPKARFFGDRADILQRKDHKWVISNPVNPEDNYADSWTNETAEAFFRWVSVLKNDFVLTPTDNDAKYFSSLKSGLGLNFVERTLPVSKSNLSNNPKPIIHQAKPWGYIHDSV